VPIRQSVPEFLCSFKMPSNNRGLQSWCLCFCASSAGRSGVLRAAAAAASALLIGRQQRVGRKFVGARCRMWQLSWTRGVTGALSDAFSTCGLSSESEDRQARASPRTGKAPLLVIFFYFFSALDFTPARNKSKAGSCNC
jgi:hypothetical protein